MKHTFLLFLGIALFAFKPYAQTTVTDYDGNVYNTITIGTQVWMQKNLKVTHYRNGELIPNITNDTAWSNLTSGAYCDYNNTPSNNATYGELYNWYTVVDLHNLCPTSWHVPTDAEWTILTDYLGGESVAGGKLKETTTTHWQNPNTGATNESDFTALPGGCRTNSGIFSSIGNIGHWWSATEGSVNYAWDRGLLYSSADVDRGCDNKFKGASVRCLWDFSSNIENIFPNENIQIYPNPAIDRVYINYTETENAKMQLYDMIGKCVFESDLTNGTNDIDISSLLKGIYIIKLTGTDWTVQRKLTKE